MPIWAVCLGFEQLHLFETANSTYYSPTDVKTSIGDTYDDVALKGVFYVTPSSTELYADASDELIDNIKTKEILYHHHSYAIKLSTYTTYSALSSAYQVI